ncbi:MAG: toast rack family protein [Chloroflexota bacterium]
MKSRVLWLATVLILAALACSPTIRLPALETGPTETITILEPVPERGTPVDVEIRMGAGSLELSGGGSALMEGSIQFNVPDWRPDIHRTNSSLSVEQDFPEPGVTLGEDIVNQWALRLGDTPINLRVRAGAYSARMDFTDVTLTGLSIEDGASDATVEFGSPNHAAMTLLSYKTGASTVSLIGLGNANFDELRFDGGAGTYLLDFSGSLQHSATVHVRAGVSTVRIEIPDDVRGEIHVSGGLTDVTTIGAWTQNGEVYRNEGQGPTLAIFIDMGLGSLTIVSE